MNFLTPWFLLGALAVAGPILFHLIRRWAREWTPFSSLMFLRPTPPRVARRRQVEHPWLLLLRCLCLAVLAAAFARPFFPANRGVPAPVSAGTQRILVLDTSASMHRESLWNEARHIAERYLEKASPQDLVALLSFDRQPRTLFSFAEWSAWPADRRAALAQQRLASVSPRWLGTHLGLALTSAAEQFGFESASGQTPARRELVVISDLQEGSELDGLQGFDWPPAVHVILERVDPKRRTNAGLQILEESRKGIGQKNRVQARVVNAQDSAAERFRLNWVAEDGADVSGESTEIYLPPGQTRTFPAPEAPANIRVAALRLRGDDATFDNSAYYAEPEMERVKIAYFGSETAADPAQLRYYLERVFFPTPRRQIQLAPLNVNTAAGSREHGRAELSTLRPDRIGTTEDGPPGPDPQQRVPTPSLKTTAITEGMEPLTALRQAAFAVIPASLGSDEIKAMREWLAGGKTALLVLTGTPMGPTLAALLDVPEVRLTEVSGGHALLDGVDFQHPIFAPFAESRFSDFTRIHFWKHRRWDVPPDVSARVLAKFDDGSPALTQLPVGQGSLLVLASGWNPADSQLALSSKFPPLMQTMLNWGGGAPPQGQQYLTGDVIASPVSSGPAVQWLKPDGLTTTLAATVPFAETDAPGVYRARGTGWERRFGVNLPLAESRTSPLAPDELARLGVPLQISAQVPDAQARAREVHLQREELENQQKFWRWLIAGALGITFAETIVSGRLSHRVKTVDTSAA